MNQYKKKSFSRLENPLETNAVNITAKDAYFDKLAPHCRTYYHELLGIPDWQKYASNRFTGSEGIKTLSALKKVIGKKIFTSRKVDVLEIGSFAGETIIAADSEPEISLTVVEPFEQSVELAKLAVKALNSSATVLSGHGEKLPLSDNCMDAVLCANVIEHTFGWPDLLKEIYRVLRPGGKCLLTFPNYTQHWEGHYKIHFIPWLPGKLNELYFNLRGRNTEFLKSISFPNSSSVAKKAAASGFIVENYGLQRIYNRLQQHVEGHRPLRKFIAAHLLLKPIYKICSPVLNALLNQSHEFLLIKPVR